MLEGSESRTGDGGYRNANAESRVEKERKRAEGGHQMTDRSRKWRAVNSKGVLVILRLERQRQQGGCGRRIVRGKACVTCPLIGTVLNRMRLGVEYGARVLRPYIMASRRRERPGVALFRLETGGKEVSFIKLESVIEGR